MCLEPVCMCLEGCLHVLGAGLNVLDTGLNVLDVESARAWASFSACAAFLTHSYDCKGNFHCNFVVSIDNHNAANRQ